MSELSHVNAWIFDLDNTLYRGDAEFFAQIDKKITAFISRYLALHPTEARLVQKQYLAEYGTSLSGLMDVHGMDPVDFLDYVHDVDLDILKPSPKMRAGIAALPGRKFIFTNGSRGHAKNVGEHLQLYDLFDGVFALEDMDYIPKPKRKPYEMFIAEFDVDPARAWMAEDMARNLEVPKDMGMATLLVDAHVSWDVEPAKRDEDGARWKPEFVDSVTDDLASWLVQINL